MKWAKGQSIKTNGRPAFIAVVSTPPLSTPTHSLSLSFTHFIVVVDVDVVVSDKYGGRKRK